MAQMLPAPPRMKVIRSAGALVWRLRGEQPPQPRPGQALQPSDIEVLLVHRPRYNDWSWPKGKREAGENLAMCAVREVEEETGVAVRLGSPLTTQRYRLGSGSTKNVHYWVGCPDLSASALRGREPVCAAPLAEIDQAEWVTPEKATQLLTRRGDRRLLDELLGKLVERTLHTKALVVFRHAQPLAEADGQVSRACPLDRVGVSQAHNLGGFMSAYGVNEIYTSPWRSSLASLAPYATLTGANLHVEKSLDPEAYDADPTSARAWFRDLPGQLLSGAQQGYAVALHRRQLPAIIGELALLSSNALSRKYPQSEPRLPYGGVLVAHVCAEGGVDGQPRVVDVEIF